MTDPRVSAAQCQEWRERFGNDTTQFAIASETSFTRATVRDHVAGDCDHGEDTAHPEASNVNIQAPECAFLRHQFADGTTAEELAERTGRRWQTVVTHLTGRCTHPDSTGPTVHREEVMDRTPVSAAQCAEFRRDAPNYDTLIDYAATVEPSYYSVVAHVKGRCSHDLGISPLDIDERARNVTAEECQEIREAYRASPSVTIEELAEGRPHSTKTLQRHVRFTCTHPPGNLLVTEVAAVQDLLADDGTVDDDEPSQSV